MYRDSSIKKSQKSPNDKLLKSVYSKQKSKSEYSPSNHRSISKEQIKQHIKKAVYTSHPHPQAYRHYSEHAQPPPEPVRPTIRTSLTPKNFHYPKKTSQREVKTSKASEAKGKELFVSTGRYGTNGVTQLDLKQLFDRKRDEAKERHKEKLHEGRDRREERDKQHADRPSASKRQPLSTQKYVEEDETISVHDKNRQGSSLVREHGLQQGHSFNVRSYLTADEYSKFGERFPENFRRVGLLGRGGFSVVWLGIHRSSKRKVAVKQILTKNPHETHLKEIWFGSYFFEKGGQAREQFQDHVGINNICRLYSHEILTVDSWLYYEVCEESLGSCLFELKGETANGERYYRIVYKELVQRMAAQQDELRILILEVSKALFLINSHNIVHSDLKTENILLRTKREDDTREVSYIRGVKLIDFGSSFLFTNLKQFSMATPEYMPPEILNYILFQNKLEYDQDMLKKMEKYKNPWIIDIWSLGCIILEIVSGVPLWMSIETKIEDKNLPRVTGLFAVKNRVFSKIIQKQIEVVNNLDYHLDHHNYSGIKLTEDIREVLKRMLDLNPEYRISPFEVLTHFGVNCEPLRIPSY